MCYPLLLALLFGSCVCLAACVESRTKIEHQWDPESCVTGEPHREQLLDKLLRQLASQCSDERFQAAVALGDLGSRASKAVPALLRTMVHDSDALVRCVAGQALGCVGAPAVDGLRKLLNHESFVVRGMAVDSLSRVGKPAAPALPKLLRMLGDGHHTVRSAAAEAVGTIADFGSPTHETLRQLTLTGDKRVREAARQALQELEQGT